jgi:formylglycine-generating enzyme
MKLNMPIATCFILIFCSSSVFAQTAMKKPSRECPKNMVNIPAGNFKAGPADKQKEIFIDAFCIDRFETTQSEYKEVMDHNPSHFPEAFQPVEKVTWFEATDYCKTVGKRLPTEWEWEKAAKAGTESNFYWGNVPDGDYAWFVENSNRKTQRIGQKIPNNFDLYDMTGNVWEWTSSDHEETGKKVLRGSSWYNGPSVMGSAYRNKSKTGTRGSGFGFRCAK